MGLVKEAEQRIALWTMDAVEAVLVDVHDLWWRSPGAGSWPFAGDGPWHLIQAEAGDYAGDGADGVSSSAKPRPPLDAAEVAKRDAVTAWLQLLPDPLDRKLVWLVSWALAQGEPRPPWKRIGGVIAWAKGMDALAWRYRKGLALILCAHNGWPTRRAKVEASQWVRGGA